MEMDYEEVIHLLEAEIAELKTQRVEQPAPANKVTVWSLCSIFKFTRRPIINQEDMYSATTYASSPSCPVKTMYRHMRSL